MKPLHPKEAARRAEMLLRRHPRCSECGAADWTVNERGDISCAPCWEKTRAELRDALKRRMK